LLQVSEDEKAKLAAEVHDDFGSILTLLSLKVNDMGRHLGDADSQLAVDHREITSLLGNLIESQRRIVGSLRPILLVTFGLEVALRHYIADWTKSTHVDAQLDLPSALPDLEPALALTLYRVVQESLTNVVRHAKASRVNLIVAVDESDVRLSIEDNGVGIAQSNLYNANSHGVIGMRERVARFGGQLSVVSGPDGCGTRVVAVVPVGGHIRNAGKDTHRSRTQ
jgi:signal transduction histidine kinase